MPQDFKGSLQKELLDQRKSSSSKYRLIFIGQKNLLYLVKYELIMMAISWIPGALGFFLRKIFYPRLLNKVGRGVVFGRNITIRHPHKIPLTVLCFRKQNWGWVNIAFWRDIAILWPGEIIVLIAAMYPSCFNLLYHGGGLKLKMMCGWGQE